MILMDKENHSAILVGTAYGVKYYEIDDRRQTSFCCMRINYGICETEFGDNKPLYFTCITFGDKADYIRSVTDETKPTLLVAGRIEMVEYKGQQREQLVVEYVSVQPSLPAAKKKREEDFFDIDL